MLPRTRPTTISQQTISEEYASASSVNTVPVSTAHEPSNAASMYTAVVSAVGSRSTQTALLCSKRPPHRDDVNQTPQIVAKAMGCAESDGERDLHTVLGEYNNSSRSFMLIAPMILSAVGRRFAVRKRVCRCHTYGISL